MQCVCVCSCVSSDRIKRLTSDQQNKPVITTKTWDCLLSSHRVTQTGTHTCFVLLVYYYTVLLYYYCTTTSTICTISTSTITSTNLTMHMASLKGNSCSNKNRDTTYRIFCRICTTAPSKFIPDYIIIYSPIYSSVKHCQKGIFLNFGNDPTDFP